MTRAPSLTLGATLIGAAVTALAQQTPPRPVFRGGVDYVQLDVVVTDKNDRAVRDLAPADFEIVEDHRPQTISTFQFVSIPAVRRPVPELSTTAPTIDVATNTHSPAGRQWVVVIDDLHIMEQHLRGTKQVVQEFLQSLPSDDQVAIVFVSRSDLSQDFTSDLGALLRTVDRIKASLGFAHDAGNTPPVDPHDAGNTPPVDPEAKGVNMEPRERHRYDASTITVLRNISAALIKSSYPRKALVFISEGFTVKLEDQFSGGFMDLGMDGYDARDTFETLHYVYDEARRAGVPVYPIDPRGIPDCTVLRGDCRILPWENIHAQWNNMRELAENTGGLAFVNRGNLADAVREIIDDSSSYYLLGYYPQPFVRDGRFHDVDVRVTRPGLRVRARKGYSAPAANANAPAAIAKTVDDALGAAQPIAGLTLRASALPIAAAAHGMTTAIALQVTMPAPADGARLDDDVQLGVVAIDHDGAVKGSARRTFHFTGSPRGAKEITYQVNDAIDLPSQPLILRLAVASRASGAVGSIHVPVEPINPSRSALQMSALAIGFDGPPREAAVPAGALARLMPLQPTTARTFAAADSLRVFGRLFWSAKAPAAAATIAVVGGPDPPRPVTITPTVAAGRHADSFEVTQPLAGLAPGSYSLRVVATLPNGETASREVAFEIR
ncbi:MAG TPA: VWA domain-containing protein [Vicinamibacterales bacterium]|nr:VWA domain-containing protein [Vicinamibacterales bacterium]